VAGDKKPYAERIRKMVGAPEGYKVISLLAIGPTAEETHAEKRPLSDVLHWEKF
jgi:nitroreductase